MTRPEAVSESAVALAHRLLARPAFQVAWGGRTRLVSTADGTRARWASVLAIPAHRRPARVWRSMLAAKIALVPPERSRASLVGDHWLRGSLAHLVPLDAAIGTSGPFQSLLVRLVNPASGCIEAIAKVMVSARPDAFARVRTEAEAMHDAEVHDVVPGLIAEGAIDGQPFLVMRYITGRSLGASRIDLVRAHQGLKYQEASARRVPAKEHPWLELVLEKLPSVGLDQVSQELGVVRMHGDYAPWNVLWTPVGRPVIIDWEASVLDGVAYADLAHYVLVVERFLRRRSPIIAMGRAVRTVSERLTVGQYEARALVALGAAAAILREGPEQAATGVDHYWRAVIAAALERDSTR